MLPIARLAAVVLLALAAPAFASARRVWNRR
jgi:hypothetical protein